MARTFVGMARTWLAVAVIIFRATGGFSTGLGFVPSCPIPPCRVISASSGWTQIFEVCRLGLVQTHLLHYRLEFRHGFRSLWFLGRLRKGLVGVSTSNMGKVPGGFGTTRAATLWFSFTSGVGIAPSLLFEGRIRRLPMMAVSSPSWRTGARLPGPASDSAPGSASGSPAPSVA